MDKENKIFFLNEVKGHLATLNANNREIMVDTLKNGYVFAMRNIEETMVIFALYKIDGITYADFSNYNEDYFNNRALLEKDLTNLELLDKVEIYARD